MHSLSRYHIKERLASSVERKLNEIDALSYELSSKSIPIRLVKEALDLDLKLTNQGHADCNDHDMVGYEDIARLLRGGFNEHLCSHVIKGIHRCLFRAISPYAGQWARKRTKILMSLNDELLVKHYGIKIKDIPRYMRSLHIRFHKFQKAANPILLIGAYLFDFVAIHPFHDGNGRISRLLIHPLLEREGVIVGRYTSYISLIQESQKDYSLALFDSSQLWHSGRHDLNPWLEYFTGVIKQAHEKVLLASN